MQHTAIYCNILQRTATHYNTLQRTAIHCNTLQHPTLIRCENVRKQTATHCNTQQHTAQHCNTLQHTSCMKRDLSLRVQLSGYMQFFSYIFTSYPYRSLLYRYVSVIGLFFICMYVYEYIYSGGSPLRNQSLLIHAVCCRVLQYVAVCCSVLQYVAVSFHMYIYIYTERNNSQKTDCFHMRHISFI